jgi:hypothetical protein
MGTHLESIKLWGLGSTMPGIPGHNIAGELIAEPAALIFRAKNGEFTLAIPWAHIKECYSQWIRGSDLGSLACELFTVFLITAREWFVTIAWYSADHDMDMRVSFFIGNSVNGPLVIEKRATALAKAIWTIRSERLAEVRESVTVQFRA